MWVGPREYLKGHLWFGYYHTISLVPFLLYGLIIYLLMKYRLSFHIHRPGILYLLGLLILVWQFTEMGESFARHLKPITPYENINFADVLSYQVKGFAVYMIHTSSILFGIMFLHLGRQDYEEFIFIALMAVIAVMLIATVTHAGIFGKITKILSVEKILGLAVSGTFGFLGLKFGASKVIKWRKLTTEGVDVDVAIYKSTKPSSPGGAQITGEEIDKILKEGGEFNW